MTTCRRRSVLCIVATLACSACGPDVGACQSHGGTRRDGICVCPTGSTTVGDSCVEPDDDGGGEGVESGDREVDAATPAATRDAESDARLPGVDAASDARSADAARAPQADSPPSDAPGGSTSPQLGDAAVRSPVDAGSVAPAIHDAGGGLPSVGSSDASTVGEASGPDMANGTCTPRGDWTYTSSASGNCAAPAARSVMTFDGHLEDPYVADDSCTTLWFLINGDCELHYTSTCGSEVRQGSIVMTSPTELGGSYTISGPSDCSSQVTVSGTKN